MLLRRLLSVIGAAVVLSTMLPLVSPDIGSVTPVEASAFSLYSRSTTNNAPYPWNEPVPSKSISSKPDLVAAISVPTPATFGQPFPVSVQITNRGDVTGDPVYLKIVFTDQQIVLSQLPSGCVLVENAMFCTLDPLTDSMPRTYQFTAQREWQGATCKNTSLKVSAVVRKMAGEKNTFNNSRQAYVKMHCIAATSASAMFTQAASSATKQSTLPNSLLMKCSSSYQCGNGAFCTTELGDCMSCCPPDAEVCIAACCGTCRPLSERSSSSSSSAMSSSSSQSSIYDGDDLQLPDLKLTMTGPTYGPIGTPFTLTANVESVGALTDQSTELTVSWIFTSPQTVSMPAGCKQHYPYGGISGYPVRISCPVAAITASTPGRTVSFPFTFQLNNQAGFCPYTQTSMIFEVKPLFTDQRTPVGNVIHHQEYAGNNKVPLLFTHRCASSSSAAIAVCGNGKLEMPEWCDDSNTTQGDGCNKCLTEPGWSCTKQYGLRSVCTKTQCGNGVLNAGEQCDDGNLKLNDGCGGDCKVEYGFSCAVYQDKPSICNRGTCGNGRWDLYEDCDDGNKRNGDGCSAACTYEYGWVCNKTPNPDVCTKNEDAWKPKQK